MSHPYAKHNEQDKARSRVSTILKGQGAGATKRAEGGAFSRVNSKSEAIAHETKAGGSKQPGRFARGGKVKHNKGHTNIIIAAPQGSSSPTPAGPQAGAPPPIPMGAPAPPPMGGGPGGPGGPPPPPMPMRARGGKVTAGALTGVGRLQKARKK